jgi:hypothetical protein
MEGDGGYITDLRDDDVLLGRGSGPNDHEGNIRFRNLVADRKAEYMATNHRLTKAKIAQEIVDRVFAHGGRFLRRLESDEIARFDVPDGFDAWMLASEETTMEKAKQALRQNTNKAKPPGGLSDDPKAKLSPRRLSPKPPASRRSPVPAAATTMATLPTTTASSSSYDMDPRIAMGPGPGLHAISVPRLDDFEPIPLDQAYPRSSSDPNLPPPSLQQQQQQQQPMMPAPSHRTARSTSSHDAYRQALAQRGRPTEVSVAAAPTRVELSPPPPSGLHRGPALVAVPTSSLEPLPGPVQMTAPPQRADTLDLQDDSILAHLPAHVRAQFLRGANAIASVGGGDNAFGDDGTAPISATVGARSASNQSMDQIPLEDDYYADDDDRGGGDDGGDGAAMGTRTGGQTQRLASMDMTELSRYHGRRERYQASEDNMSVVMDSFSKLKASGEEGGGGGGATPASSNSGRYRYYNRRWSNQTTESERNRMLASTDTMGTIEPIGVGSMADMSFATMNSSTFSIYRGNEISEADMVPPGSPGERGGVPRVVVGGRGQLPSSGGPAEDGLTGSSAAAGALAPLPAGSDALHQAPMMAGRFETSFSHADLPISRTAARYQQVAMSNPQRQDAIREDYEEAYDGVVGAAMGGGGGLAVGAVALNSQPPMPNRLMEDDPTGGELGIDGTTWGLSSMELLKSAFHSSTDWDIPAPQPFPPSQAQSQSDGDPNYPHLHQQEQQPPPTA